MMMFMMQPQAPQLPLHSTPSEDNARWEALLARDAGVAQAFVYAVRTTGVFCHVGCPSRLPVRRNVLFFDTAAAAQQAGFRACLRCRPTQPEAGDPAVHAMKAACRWMAQHSSEPTSTAALAAQAGMSPAHFHRAFQRIVGITPKRFATNLRMQQFKAELKRGGTVTDSLYASGFGSSSRLYEKTDRSLGMVPAAYRAGGVGIDLSYTTLETSLGLMLLAASDRGICYLQFTDDGAPPLEALSREFPNAILHAMNDAARPEFNRWVQAIQQCVDGTSPAHNLPLDLRATAFQLRVWDHLQTIPAGESRSYAQAATELGIPNCTRSVASACARNRVALLVPCHRVLRGDGTLGGYRWGLDRKRTLLDREAATRGSQTPAAPSTP